MYETSQMDKLVFPLKWGFLADGVLFLVERQIQTKEGITLTEKDKNIIHGAIEFLELVLAAVRNKDAPSVINGDLRRTVEALTLYGYVVESPTKENLSPDQISGELRHLQDILRSWISDGAMADKDLELLRVFFKPISEVTLRESNALLTPRSSFSVLE